MKISVKLQEKIILRTVCLFFSLSHLVEHEQKSDMVSILSHSYFKWMKCDQTG